LEKPIQQTKSTPVTDRSLWYTDLSSLDPKSKNELWAAQCLSYMKRSSVVFLDPAKAKKYRMTDSLDLNKQEYKEMVDPKTPSGAGGTASYFSSDFMANPIYIHLKNIVKAQTQKTGKQLEVSVNDKYAKTRRMKDNYEILYKEHFRKVINALGAEVGLPPLSQNQDPFKWAKNFFSKDNSEDGQRKQQSEVIDKYASLIRNQISDDQDLALYNELIYKGDYELAFELGIDYYINTLNKWPERWADEVIDDIMHFNKFSGEWYTDLITGRPVIERFVPEILWTSKFTRKDGEDIMHYHIEYDISFGDFTRLIGRDLSAEKLKEVFMLNKSFGGGHGMEWNDEAFNLSRTNLSRDNAKIRIGRAAFLSQDMDVQIEDTNTGMRFVATDITWQPMEGQEHLKRIEKNYNVWRWWYYIPPTGDPTMNADYTWQANFIFQLQKYQDQFRFGQEGRFAKSPLVIYDNSSQATFTDITMSFMPKIHHLWHKYQNFIVNNIDATIMSDELIGGLLGAVEESNNVSYGSTSKPTAGTGINPYMEQWKMIKQAGTGFLKMTDKNGNMVMDPSKLVVTIKNGFMEQAERCLVGMMMQYDLLIKSLALSPMTTGEEIKPRTPVAALEQSLKASDNATFFIQKAYEDVIKMYGERIIQYIIKIRQKDDEGFPQRWEEFMDNIGYANGLALEGLKDVPAETVGLKVSYVDNTSKKEFIMNLALEFVKTKELNEDFLYLIMGCDNWKYSYVLMRMAMKQRRKEMERQQAIAHQQIMEQKEADLQIAITLQGAKDSGKDQNIATQGQVDDMVNRSLNKAKEQSQIAIKEATAAFKSGENEQKTGNDMTKETHKKNLELQTPVEQV
jgi:hypothetical protein